MFIRLFLIIIFLPLQSCTNTLIGEKLEKSFETTDNPKASLKSNDKLQKINKKTKIESIKQVEMKENENDFVNTTREDSKSSRGRLDQKSIKLINNTIFNPQPYRIIIKLSGADPSAPAETVTEALRKAGIQFEVEKIERFYVENLSKDKLLKR